MESFTNGVTSRQQSPHSTSRSLIRDLTLPPNPNFDIPQSPPDSPPLDVTEKFAHFLELKKQGVHYNDKLAKSSILKNPSITLKLMDFAGIQEGDQYASSLPKNLWNHEALPEWAYKEELSKSQQKMRKRNEEEKAREQRQSIDFVPATTSEELNRSSISNYGVAGKTLGRSAAERVMAGLDRERTASPHLSDGNRKKDRERR
jgi:hypothetical protein